MSARSLSTLARQCVPIVRRYPGQEWAEIARLLGLAPHPDVCQALNIARRQGLLRKERHPQPQHRKGRRPVLWYPASP